MKGFDNKSIMLGIGIGIIITSVISLIFMLGYRSEPSKDEIRTLAIKHGILDNSKTTFNPNNSDEFELVISDGDNVASITEKLLQSGVIESKLEFQVEINKNGMSKRIEPGIYKIKRASSIKEIIEQICK